MPKFQKTENELQNRYDKWLYVLKSLPKFQKKPQILQEQVFEKLFHIAELAKFSPVEMWNYEESLKIYRDNYAVMKTAQRKEREEGIMEGKVEGKMERNIEIAENLYRLNIPLSQIMQATGLTKSQLAEILK